MGLRRKSGTVDAIAPVVITTNANSHELQPLQGNGENPAAAHVAPVVAAAAHVAAAAPEGAAANDVVAAANDVAAAANDVIAAANGVVAVPPPPPPAVTNGTAANEGAAVVAGAPPPPPPPPQIVHINFNVIKADQVQTGDGCIMKQGAGVEELESSTDNRRSTEEVTSMPQDDASTGNS
ncbi:hypothetical protein ScPMuIL_014564 [Solemya velum]